MIDMYIGPPTPCLDTFLLEVIPAVHNSMRVMLECLMGSHRMLMTWAELGTYVVISKTSLNLFTLGSNISYGITG